MLLQLPDSGNKRLDPKTTKARLDRTWPCSVTLDGDSLVSRKPWPLLADLLQKKPVNRIATRIGSATNDEQPPIEKPVFLDSSPGGETIFRHILGNSNNRRELTQRGEGEKAIMRESYGHAEILRDRLYELLDSGILKPMGFLFFGSEGSEVYSSNEVRESEKPLGIVVKYLFLDELHPVTLEAKTRLEELVLEGERTGAYKFVPKLTYEGVVAQITEAKARGEEVFFSGLVKSLLFILPA